jgi:peptidoglycan/LPS O-acetylase OafA/YrhL
MVDSEGTAPAVRSAQLVSIQHLRGIAALFVVIFHLKAPLAKMGYHGFWLPGLSAGVDIFFVISGFIMWVTTFGRTVAPGAFMRKRLARIVPIYWLLTTFVVVVLLIAPSLVQSGRIVPAHVIASYLFLPYVHPVIGGVEPVVPVGWTLNLEMLFYVVFAVALLLPPRPRFVVVALFMIGLSALGLVLRTPPGTLSGFYLSSIMVEFVTGMALGVLASSTTLLARPPAWIGAAVTVVCLVWLSVTPGSTHFRFLHWGILATLIVAGALVVEARGRLPTLPPLRLIGDASYSLYLTHFLALSAAGQVWRKLGLGGSIVGRTVFCVLATLACLAVAILCYRLIEQPLGRLFAGHTDRHRTDVHGIEVLRG